jgi:small GTP-binding protein
MPNPIDKAELTHLIDQAAAKGWEELDLSKRELSSLPPEIWKLTGLKRLILHNNQITEIPEAIAALTSLTVLSLSRNQITEIPEAIAKLTSLSQLNLDNNQITVIPEAIAKLTSLSRLDLSNNQIAVIPEAIAALTSLSQLYLSNNQITVIPEAIAKLTSLSKLVLSNNQITVIPEAIAKLTSLSKLNLGNNQITVIPEAIAALTSLSVLDLDDNYIREIPEAIAALTKLEQLYLESNPIQNVPPEIIRKGWSENVWENGEPQVIFTYLKSATKHPLNELKILLVGEGDVGKTSLLNRLIQNTFNPNEPKTPGINIQPWRLPNSNSPIRLNLWDFGGQRVMHSTHQFFLTQRSLYILVLDNRKNEAQNRIEYWLKLIETYGGNSPVIIVGNCSDEHPLEIKTRTLQKKYPQIKQVLSTSCKTGDGIDTLCQVIAAQIDHIPHVRDLVPQSWLTLKTQLEQMRAHHDFISYEKYQTLCTTAAIATPQDQETLVSVLHDLGIILNYRNDPRLSETHVLNPEWVTSGVYDILNNHDLMVNKKGILTLTELTTILKQPDRYPMTKRPFLMGLMEKFELCFKLDDPRGDRYLISDLLPIDEPDVDAYETAPLHFQYQYDILPSSIISRFIVRNHTLIYKTMRWRSGAVLTRDHSKALVRADEEENTITIKAQGSRASALLDTIRTDFTKLHPNLAVQELLVVREIVDGKPTGREVPVDYTHLCDLERQGTLEAALPRLKGKYNIRNLLEGVEAQDSRQRHLNDRLDRSRKTRSDRPLRPLPKSQQRPGLVKTSVLMLFVLAIIAAIFAAIAHYVPGLNLVVTVIAVLAAFGAFSIIVLRATGIITDSTFQSALAGFWKALPLLKGKDAAPPANSEQKAIDESQE